MADLISRPYRPDPTQCCDLCVWGTGEHERWCPRKLWTPEEFTRLYLNGPDDFRLDVEIVIQEGRKS